MTLFRRAAVTAAAVASLATVLVGCSSGDAGSSGSGGDAPAVVAEEGALPVTLTHKYGETTIDEAPARVVSLGYSDQDALLALGVTPVAVREWDGMVPEGKAVGDWAADKVKGRSPEVYDSPDIDPEAIAVMDPDLIVASYSGIDQATYDALSKIAPVVAQKGDYEDYQQPWDVTTVEIGKAVGKPAEAGKLVAGIRDRMSGLSGKHPEWKGKTVTVATFDGESLSAFASKDMRTSFFRELGFEATPQIDAAAGDKFYASFSLEEARQIDADLVVWDQLSYAPGGRSAIEGEPALAALGAVKDGRSVYLGDTLEKAFGWQTVLSLEYVLDHIEAELGPAVK